MLTAIRRKLPLLLVGWLVIICLIYGVAALFMASALQHARSESIALHLARIDPDAQETGRTGTDQSLIETLDTGRQSQVEVGVYVDRIPHLSLREADWTVDFYIWFRWQGRSFNPGATFQVIDGEILRRSLESEYQDGERQYALYRVQARLTKFFAIDRFPRDDHLLTLRVEDSERQIDRLIYVPDETGSTVSSRVAIPGYVIYETDLLQKPHSYKTRRGDPRLPEEYKATYSQMIFGISIMRPGWALYIKMFLGTFSSVAIALVAFLVNPGMSGPRFAVGVGAFFAGVASTYVVSNLLPQSGVVGLTDFVTSVSLVTIFLTIMTSAISVSLQSDESLWATRRRFDIAALLVFVACYIGLNVILAQVSSI